MLAAVKKLLLRFLSVREGARKFHAPEIGPVDPRKCWADFLVRVATRDEAGLEKQYRSVWKTAALSETGGGTVGGYLVPEELRYDLMVDVADQSLFRGAGAWVVPMESDLLDLPMPDPTQTPATGQAPFWGGLQFFWATEAAARTQNTIQWRKIQLTAWNLTGYLRLSINLARDGGRPLEEVLRGSFARSLAWYEDYAFLQGTGAGQPLGVIKASGRINVSRSGGANTFTAADAQAMLVKHWGLHEYCWAISRTAVGQLTSLTGWFPNGPLILHGGDVYLTSKQPPLGSVGDVVLFDPSMYVIGDRETLVAFSDQTSAFLSQQGDWLVNHRVDGQPLLSAPIVLPDSAAGGGSPNKVSPFVVLN